MVLLKLIKWRMSDHSQALIRNIVEHVVGLVSAITADTQTHTYTHIADKSNFKKTGMRRHLAGTRLA